MATIDIFRQDAFSTVELTAAVERSPFLPTGLGELNIFNPKPIITKALMVEERAGKLIVIPTSTRGAPATERETERRKVRYFDIPRLFHGDTITADELQSIRAFGSTSELMNVQDEVARRVNGPVGLTSNIEYTKEFQRLGAVQGILIDADGSVIYDWFDEFGITQPEEIIFNLAAKSTSTLRPICNHIRRTMARKAQGAFSTSTKVYALVGDEFYDRFVTHPDVEKTFLNWSGAADLRGTQGAAFDEFPFAGITWLNYRGSDDNTTLKVPDNEVKFFPVGAPNIFQVAYAPAEMFNWVNTPGKSVYVIPIIDRDRNAFVRMEVYSYPLHICTRPEVLLSGKDVASTPAGP